MTLSRESWSDSLVRAVSQTHTPEQFVRGWLDWTPHDAQMRWLAAPERSTAVLVTGRRWGKSEVAAMQALYYALFRPGSRQGIVSVTLDQARLSFDVALQMVQRQPVLSALVDKVKDSPFPLLRFKHGSEITVRTAARNGIYLRGHKFHRCVVDEADYVSERVIDEVVRMTLADVSGQLVLISTPRAQRGLVYRELRRGLGGDERVYAQVGATWENPNVSHEYIRSLRDRMTASAWQREVEGIYTDDDAAVFRWEDVQAGYEGSDWPLPEERKPGKRYALGADLAKSQDWTVIAVLEVTTRPYRLVSFERFQRLPWPEVEARIRRTAQRYAVRIHESLIDATGVGAAVLDAVKDVADGFVFTARTKVDLLNNLQLLFERRELAFPFVRELVDELQGYAWDDKGLSTDCVMALALAGWAAGHGKSRRLITW